MQWDKLAVNFIQDLHIKNLKYSSLSTLRNQTLYLKFLSNIIFQDNEKFSLETAYNNVVNLISIPIIIKVEEIKRKKKKKI